MYLSLDTKTSVEKILINLQELKRLQPFHCRFKRVGQDKSSLEITYVF